MLLVPVARMQQCGWVEHKNERLHPEAHPLMNRCPTCGSYYRDEQVCQRDGTPLDPTDAIIDRYEIVDRLGVGGMGTVYKAIHTLLDNRTVAIKLLHRELSQNPEVVNRFFREARAASRVENEHIVEVVDFGVTPAGDSFLVMEYLDGISLRDLLEDHGAMSLSRALAIGVQIAEGLYSAHRKGIVHRDLKPENVVLIRREGKRFVKLLDFGIAKLTEQQDSKLTIAGMVVGTPTYMSPEQAGGETVDHRTDIYALGTILYEMLTGQPPFSAETTKQILMAQLTQTPRPPRELKPEIPAAVEGVILHTLEKDRDRRPETMLHLAYELRDALKGQHPAGAVKDPLDAMIEESEPRDETDNTLRVRRQLSGPLQVLPAPVRRFLPLLGLGAGLVLGITVTVLLMRSDGSEAGAGTGTGSSALVARGARDQGTPVRPDLRAMAVRPPDARAAAVKVRRPHHLVVRHPKRRRPPPPPPPPPPPVARGQYVATVVSIPAGAAVYERDTKLGRAPLKVETDRPRRLTVHTLGHESKNLVLPRHSKATFTVKLSRSTMSWEVLSLSQLKGMMDKGQISHFTYKRRREELIRKRDKKILQLRVKFKIGEITEEQYKRAVEAVKESYK